MDKKPGRPRIHEVGKWSVVQFRLPLEMRIRILNLLEEKNNKLPYKMSLNHFILELIQKSLPAVKSPEISLKDIPSSYNNTFKP